MTIYSRPLGQDQEQDLASNIFERIDAETKSWLIDAEKSHEVFYILAVSQFKRDIRNEFGLWLPECPLTSNWHLHPSERDIRDGIDYSQDHPDAVSNRIFEKLIDLIKKEQI